MQLEKGPLLKTEQRTHHPDNVLETTPALDRSGLEGLRDRRINQLRLLGDDSGSRAQLDGHIQRLGLPEGDIASAQQEVGYSATSASLAQEQQALLHAAQAEMAQVMGSADSAPVSFAKHLASLPQRLSLEQDPNKRMEMRTETVRALQQEFSAHVGSEDAQIEAFQRTHPEALHGLELSLIQANSEQIVIVDENGRLKKLLLNQETAAATLADIKSFDERLGRKGGSHELRQEVLRRSGGSISTHEAYTYGTERPNNLKDYLDNPENWTPERRRLQQEILDSELKKAMDLSRRMNDEQGSIYALRGNTAAGKTTSLKQNPLFSNAINPNTKQPDGAINPDTYKALLKESEAGPFGWTSIAGRQTHNEGSMLARRLERTMQNSSEASLIIDKRLNEKEDIEVLLKTAERTGKPLKFLDVDAPLIKSLVGVLGRQPGGTDPLVPFGAVAEGYEGVKKNRVDLIRHAIQDERIKTYVLYAPGPDGKPTLVAEKKDGKFEVYNKELFSEAIGQASVRSVVDSLKQTVINDENIEKVLAPLAAGDREYSRNILKNYKGSTFEQALNNHAREKNGPDYYVAASQRNLEVTSRTAKGVVDTSASPDKAGKMAADLTPDKAAERAQSNFKNAIKELFSNRDRSFQSPNELRTFIEGMAMKVNQGILKEGESVIRGGADSPKYPYTRIANLESAMTQFYDELHARLADPNEDPVKLAAWAEYRIDMTDHFFADGCGKMAKAVSAFILMRARLPLPTYKNRDEYYRYGRKQIRDPNVPESNDPEVQAFADYYKTLVKTL